MIKLDTITVTLTTGTEFNGLWYYSERFMLDLSKYNKILTCIPVLDNIPGINIPYTIGYNTQNKYIWVNSSISNSTVTIRVNIFYI